MAIKDSKKNISQKAVQKTKKVKSDVANHIATIDYDEDGDSGSFSVLQNTTKMKKKKHLVKQKDPDKKGTKKKKQSKKDSELKNKECANLPIMMEISSDSESLTDTRKICKTAKNKGDGTVSCERESVCEVPLEGLPEEQQGSNFFNRLARKRSAPVSNRDDVEFIVKKKKKKGGKEGHKHACPLMLLTKDAKNETPEQIFPNPKVISQKTPLSSKGKGWTDVQNSAGDIVKKKKAAVDNQESNKHILETGIASTMGCFHKGQLSKKRTWGCEQQQEDDRHVSEEETKAISQKGGKKKKKKLKKEKVALFVTSANSQKNSSGVSNENSLTLKSKTQLLIDLEPGADEDCKMMKKKQMQTKVGSNRLDVSVKKRKEKKGKKSEVLQVHTGSGNEDEVEEKKEKKKKKKGKDRESKEFQNSVEGEPGLRKAKLKREVKGQEDEIKAVASKKGNCDEVNIDKQRRQALQEENDLESGRTKVVKREKESDVHFGQWGTAVFENSEQKAKFLRLLGGFKKGPSVPTPDSPASATKLTMALDRSQEKELRQSLEAEFEKAVAWKHRRGTGLGFQPAAQKQTYIDKYASKSIKFED